MQARAIELAPDDEDLAHHADYIAIERQLTNIERAVRANDHDALEQTYATTARVHAPGRAVITGREAIRAAFSEGPDFGPGDTYDIATEAIVPMDGGYYHRAEITREVGGKPSKSDVIVFWTEEGGEWRTARQMWTTYAPEAEAVAGGR